MFFKYFLLLPPPYYGRSIPGPPPKTHASLPRVAVEGANLIKIIIVNNAVFKTKEDRLIHFPPSPNRNPDIQSQFLSGELTVIELGNIFTHGTMPAASALPGTSMCRPGQCQARAKKQKQNKQTNGGRLFEYEKSYSSSCQQFEYSTTRRSLASYLVDWVNSTHISDLDYATIWIWVFTKFGLSHIVLYFMSYCCYADDDCLYWLLSSPFYLSMYREVVTWVWPCLMPGRP